MRVSEELRRWSVGSNNRRSWSVGTASEGCPAEHKLLQDSTVWGVCCVCFVLPASLPVAL